MYLIAEGVSKCMGNGQDLCPLAGRCLLLRGVSKAVYVVVRTYWPCRVVSIESVDSIGKADGGCVWVHRCGVCCVR